jgi:putative glutamine amidotransferase
MRRPAIGISMDHTAVPARAVIRDAYYEAVHQAGGLPMPVAPLLDSDYLEAALARMDALVMPGADDYHPALWGEEDLHPSCTLVTARRQEGDVRVLRIALHRGLPLLAICGSMQAMNIVCGGTVIQDLPSARTSDTTHQGPPGAPARHDVDVEDGSLLHQLTGSRRIDVNSYHHQACGRPGPGLRVTARAPDGVVEALELDRPGAFALGVQWHPEKLVEEPAHRGLFQGLCEAARRRAASRHG